MDLTNFKDIEKKLTDITITKVPISTNNINQDEEIKPIEESTKPKAKSLKSKKAPSVWTNGNIYVTLGIRVGVPKYSQMLDAIAEIGRNIRPFYCGFHQPTERLKRSLNIAKALVKDCIKEHEKAARQFKSPKRLSKRKKI